MRAPLSRFSALVIPGMALPLVLAGCSMAPAYRPPATVAIPPQFKEEPGWAVATPSDAVARGAWWDLFRDPVLDSLEQKVAVTNQNVASYRAAYQAARALVQVQRSALFPSLTASASGTRSQDFAGQNVTGGTGVSTTTTGATVSRYSLSIGASWEPDLWGRLGNTVNQAKANAQASEGDLANATLSAQGELATNYVQLRGIDAQRVLLDRTVADYTRALAITTNKYKAGTVSHADVFEAQTTLSNAQATRADLDRQRAVLEHAIAVLVGENPSTFALPAVDWQPVVPEIPAQVPAALLQRRPDIAAAERRVAAANANVGIQKAAYFPQVTLSSSVGTNSSVIRFTTRKGSEARARARRSTLAITAPRYRQLPTGGVTRPTPRFITMITPNWMGSTPTACATGSRMGANRIRAGTRSITMPTNNRKTLIVSSTMILPNSMS